MVLDGVCDAGPEVTSFAERTLIGVVAGAVATVPMTLVMVWVHRNLPRSTQYPAPPRLITDKLTNSVSPGHGTTGLLHVPTLAAHFGFGGAAGAVYGMIVGRRHANASTGCLFGLLVWAASYLGWVPAAGILPPATEHPGRRVVMMLISHVVWGSALGFVTASVRGWRLAARLRPDEFRHSTAF